MYLSLSLSLSLSLFLFFDIDIMTADILKTFQNSVNRVFNGGLRYLGALPV